MTGITLPIILAALGVVAALTAHRGIRRGAARFYQLERDAILRRASFTLLAAICLFMGSVGLLAYNHQQLVAAETEPSAEAAPAIIEQPTVASQQVAPPVTVIEEGSVDSVAPTFEPPPTEDPNQPTPVPTPLVRRAIIEGTGGSGAYLRERPGTDAADLVVLNEFDQVILLDNEEPVEANGYTWLEVRTPAGVEGWIADIFLTVSER